MIQITGSRQRSACHDQFVIALHMDWHPTVATFRKHGRAAWSAVPIGDIENEENDFLMDPPRRADVINIGIGMTTLLIGRGDIG